MKLTPYQPPLTENEILATLKRNINKDPYGCNVYETAHIQTLLDIITRQEKEIKHCQKYLTRVHAWKNKFWFSVQRVNRCNYSRQIGLQGRQVFGYSVRLRVLGREII